MVNVWTQPDGLLQLYLTAEIISSFLVEVLALQQYIS